MYWVDLSKTRVTDAGLKQLGDMQGLRVLGLQDTAVTPAGIDELKRQLPDIRIRYNSPN